MGHPFFLSRVIVQGEYLAKYLFPSCRRHGSPVLPAIIPIGPFWHFTGLGKHEQDAVEQAVLLKTFRQQFVYALGLCGPDDVDARLFNMHRYRSDSGVKSDTTVRRSTGFLPLSPAAFHVSSSDSYALNRA